MYSSSYAKSLDKQNSIKRFVISQYRAHVSDANACCKQMDQNGVVLY